MKCFGCDKKIGFLQSEAVFSGHTFHTQCLTVEWIYWARGEHMPSYVDLERLTISGWALNLRQCN